MFNDVVAHDRRDGEAYIMARRAGACANPIAPEQRAHDELANSPQLPPRPDLELNMKFSFEFELGGFESRQ